MLSNALSPEGVDENEADHIDSLVRWSVWAIRISSTALGVLFAWVQLRTFSYAPIIENANPFILTHLILALYYLSWVGGVSFDVFMQKRIYRDDPLRGNMPLQAFAAVGALFVLAIALLWSAEDERKFSLVLVTFLAANVYAWRVLVARVTPVIESTKESLIKGGKYISTEQLLIFEQYITGYWQWFRYASLAAILAFMNIIVFWAPFREMLARGLMSYTGASADSLSKLLPFLCLALFAAAAELWVWWCRIRASITIQILDSMKKKYRLIMLQPNAAFTESL